MRRETELSVCVRRLLSEYFKHLDGEKPSAIYSMVLQSVERPLLEVVLYQAEGNQTKAAAMLGLNRNTLRKKMQEYGIK